jgi:hypothetical protein
VWVVCLRCKFFKGFNTDGTVECEVLGEVKPKLLCMHFEPGIHVEKPSARLEQRG